MCFKALRKYIPAELLDHVDWLKHGDEQYALAVQITRALGAAATKQDLSRWLAEGQISATEIGGVRFIARASLAAHIGKRNRGVLQGGAK